MIPFVMLLGAYLSYGADETAAYPRADLLLEVDALANPAYAQRFRILDARPKTKYDAGHLPGAVWVDHNAWSKAFAATQEAKEWAQKIGALGIDNATKVAIYDESLNKNAARIWWILRYWGVKDARLVNGGWPAWTKSHFPLSKHAEMPEQADFHIKMPDAARLATKAKLLDIVKNKGAQIVDSRSEKEYCGDDKLGNERGGAIPGALHLEWSDALDPQTQRFKSAGEVTKLFRDAGIDPTKPAVTYCQSGGRAAVMAFTLELMGGKEVANYYRSWSEWGNDPATPIVHPERK
jgi:thiosulfate/3-mercaptopyruvate sulfurtransferase